MTDNCRRLHGAEPEIDWDRLSFSQTGLCIKSNFCQRCSRVSVHSQGVPGRPVVGVDYETTSVESTGGTES